MGNELVDSHWFFNPLLDVLAFVVAPGAMWPIECSKTPKDTEDFQMETGKFSDAALSCRGPRGLVESQ